MGSDNDVEQTSDGEFIIAAGGYNFSLVKTDSNGNKQWFSSYGGPEQDAAYAVEQTEDGGYIVVGPAPEGSDFWIVKTDPLGNQEWDIRFGGGDSDIADSVEETVDGGYIVAGRTKCACAACLFK